MMFAHNRLNTFKSYCMEGWEFGNIWESDTGIQYTVTESEQSESSLIAFTLHADAVRRSVPVCGAYSAEIVSAPSLFLLCCKRKNKETAHGLWSKW